MTAEDAALPRSIMDRLRNRARQEGQAFELLLTYYGMERFLYRLSRSKYRDLFVLKGALLMMSWPEGIQRATRDIDLRAYTDRDPGEVARILREVCTNPVEDDGILFDSASVEVERIVERARYPGVRARLWGWLGKAKVRIRVDIGFTDPMPIKPRIGRYPTLLDMPAPRLRFCPREIVIAEKLEAIVYLGAVNSRMKDYFDLHAMANAFRFDGRLLVNCIDSTFEERGTHIPSDIPAGLTDEFARGRQNQWTAFLRRIGHVREEIATFEHVVRVVREFALPPLRAVRQGKDFPKSWSPGKAWRSDPGVSSK